MRGFWYCPECSRSNSRTQTKCIHCGQLFDPAMSGVTARYEGTTLAQSMKGVEHLANPKPRRVARSTVEYYRPDSSQVIRLHQTDILVFTKYKTKIYTGGYYTQTTRNRIEAFVKGLQIIGKMAHSHHRLGYQEGGDWMIAIPDGNPHRGWNAIPFYEGIEIVDGKLPDAKGNYPLRRRSINQTINRCVNYWEAVDFHFDELVVCPAWMVAALQLNPEQIRIDTIEIIYNGCSQLWASRLHFNPMGDPTNLNIICKQLDIPPRYYAALKLGDSKSARSHLRKLLRDYLHQLFEPLMEGGKL